MSTEEASDNINQALKSIDINEEITENSLFFKVLKNLVAKVEDMH